MTGRPARAGAWLGGLLAALLALRLAATGDLAAPPVTSLDDLAQWADDRGPVASTFALVRFGAELVVWYLLGLSLLHAAAGVLRFSSAAALADALAVPAVSRLVRAGLGLGLVASTALHADHDTAAPAPGTATMRPLVEEPAGTAAMVPRPTSQPATAPTPAPPDEPAPTSHRVEPDESFWTIAADVLEQAWGRSASDAEIDPFWRALVEVNRHRLVSDDPDFILPGQVFEVPPVPARPTGA